MLDSTQCLTCGKRLSPSVAASGNHRCRPCARQFRAAAVCHQCGTSLAGRRATRFCSKRCTDVHRGQILAEPLGARRCALDECGAPFQPRRPMERCCSELHGKRLWARENTESSRDYSQRRRAVQLGASTGRPVILSEIAARDAWRCHLCHKRVPRTRVHPDPQSASLDHVIPLSRGGAHDPDNVRLAHLRCNVAKGNRGGGEQLLLIG